MELRAKKDIGMKICSLHLQNYRCFENFDIDFDERLTVLVGINGAGKTAILDALSLFLKWVIHYKPKTDQFPSDNDISVGCKKLNIVYNFKMIHSGSVSNDPDTFELIIERTYDKPSTLNLHHSNRSYHHKNSEHIEEYLTENPVFVSYMAGRSIPEKIKHTKQSSPNSALTKAFERTIDYTATMNWFEKLDADEARDVRDNAQKKENPELKAVREALQKALLGQYERPRIQGDPPELILYKKNTDTVYKLSQLSDGYRAMLALVMDLARRMALARRIGYQPKESILHYPAIVLIDEVELHLHPAWQQTVLTTLMDIFPNTQFIVTTHSPQVLTSIPATHIRILSDGKAYAVDDQTQGAEASRLLKYVFGVDPRPQRLPIVQDLNEYIKLVYDEKWDTPRAEKLKKELVAHFGRDDPKLMELELHIDNSNWERNL